MRSQSRRNFSACGFGAGLTVCAALLTISACSGAAAENAGPPPLATRVEQIDQVELAPLFGERFFCVEHALGELAYAGDALGTDCMVAGGIEQDPYRSNQWTGILRLYRTDGSTNADWYGYSADVMSPTAGTVASVSQSTTENVPGIMGSPPGGGVTIRRSDGIIVVLGHLRNITVSAGTVVAVGQLLGKVGNNGPSRAPHIHVGAYREDGIVPLQIRWDLRAMGLARKAAGVP